MRKWRVIRDCHWEGGYREEDEILKLPDDQEPNEHFEEIFDEREPRPRPEIDPGSTLSGMQKARITERAKHNSGMAYQEPTPEVKEKIAPGNLTPQQQGVQTVERKKPGPKPKK